ncbi:MAG: archease [Candidatus Omnitrophica bacterium]|nr:archease [Candidatus Omnitrophota bacterium]
MAEKGYTFFDHTADVGIAAEGATLAELCIHLAQGLIELLIEDSELSPRTARPVALKAQDAPSLVLAWLQEILYWFSVDRFVPAAYELAEVTPTTLRGTVRGDIFDQARHVQGREVKAITRHHLEVKEVTGRWFGRVIVDI